MSEEKKDIQFKAGDIEKYHKGLLSGREMHAMEKAALEDPFLAEALEGYAIGKTNANADIEELKNRLEERVQGAKVFTIPSTGKQKYFWLRAAAMIIMVAGAGLLVYQLAYNKRSTTISQVNPAKKQEGNNDSTPNAILLPQSSNDTVGNRNSFEKSQKDNTANAKIERRIESNAGSGLASVDKISDSAKINHVATSKEEKEAVALDDSKADVPTAEKTPKEDLPDAKIENPEVVPASPTQGYQKTRVEMQDLGRQKMKETEAQGKTLSNNNALQNAQAFRGRVIDPNNNPVPFANITNTRDKVNTYADVNGNFNLVAADSVLDVQVRSVGFENNNTQLRSDVINNQIVLRDDRNGLSEVIVVNKSPNAKAGAQKTQLAVEQPEPADGWVNYDAYLLNNVTIPEEAKAKSLSGDVLLSFDINKRGNPINIKVEKSLCQRCDQEAIRVVQSGPKWKRKSKKARASVKVPF